MKKWTQSDGFCSFVSDGSHKSFHATKEGFELKAEQLRHNIEWRKKMVEETDNPTTKEWYGQQISAEIAELNSISRQ